eukprot:1082339-Ditylum_brightwellii.AAC.1
MSSQGRSKKNNASSAAESAAATSPSPPVPLRRLPQHHKTPSPVKQAPHDFQGQDHSLIHGRAL